MEKKIFCKVFLVAILISGLLVFSGDLLAQGYSEEAFKRVMEVQEKHTTNLMANKNIVGTAVGLNQNNKLAVKIFVSKPQLIDIPKTIDGIPVQVVASGEFFALKKPIKSDPELPVEPIDPTARFDRPVPIGVSTGHPDITAGTIGCRVTDGTNVYALSNNHVYANCNLASIGDWVIQPGTYDGGVSSYDDIGYLSDFEPIDFQQRGNTIDAAIALSSKSELGNATPTNGYGTPKSTTVEAKLRMKVKKYGRTTGLTNGKVYAINATVNVNYGDNDEDGYVDIARFVNQIIITPGTFSAGGDSGSLIVSANGNPVGLLFAGSTLYTIANPIDEVLTSFGVTIDGE